MKRGDLVTVAVSGDFGKPRPALVIQANQFHSLGAVAVLLITSVLDDSPLLRVDIAASDRTGLLKPSQVMVDKVFTFKREKTGGVIGRADAEVMLQVERRLAVFLGIAK